MYRMALTPEKNKSKVNKRMVLMKFLEWMVKRCKMEFDTLTFQKKSKIMNALAITIIIFWITAILGGILLLVRS